jgi:S-adenosylmethionine hydrolase
VITFLSDFGLDDEFVGVVHGVIAKIAPEQTVIDLTHQIPPGDVRAGALALLRSIQYLPEGVVLAVVDPGVGTDRRAIAVESPWGYFIGPDNGLLAPAVAMVGGAGRVVSLEDPRFILPAAGASFDGRDRFGPAAAVLASGQAQLEDLGPLVDGADLAPLLLPLAEAEGEGVRGEVWWIDRFGNAQTNLGPDDLAALGLAPGDTIAVEVGATAYEVPWVTAYGDVDHGETLLHVDSHGLIALAVREGKASDRMQLAGKTQVVIRSRT